MTAIAKKQGLHRFEWILSKADASEFVAEMTFSVVDIEDRENIYCVCRDITERKRVESLAERERVRLRTILETASDGIHILDSEGVLVEANEAFLDMLGYDDTVIGKLHVTDWDVQDSWEVISGRIEDMIVQRKKKMCIRDRSGPVAAGLSRGKHGGFGARSDRIDQGTAWV